jgi:hypothetical protein
VIHPGKCNDSRGENVCKIVSDPAEGRVWGGGSMPGGRTGGFQTLGEGEGKPSLPIVKFCFVFW